MSSLLSLYDEHCRREAHIADPLFRVERAGPVTRVVGPTQDAYSNTILHADVSSPDLARGQVAEQIRYYQSIGHDFEWKWYSHDLPPELPAILSELGFSPGESETVMVLDARHKAIASTLPAGVTIQRAESKQDLCDIARIEEALWGEPFDWLVEALWREMQAAPDSIALYVARADGEPISAGWIRFERQFAHLHGGSTLPAFRGRGVYKHILSLRLAEAQKRGAEQLVCDATDMSRPILERLGFHPLTSTTPYVYRHHR